MTIGNGWHDVTPTCEIDDCQRVAAWLATCDEFGVEFYLCEGHGGP